MRLLDFIFAQPVFKGPHLVQHIRATKMTGARLLKRLTEAKLLTLIQGNPGRAGHTYRFEPLVQLIRH